MANNVNNAKMIDPALYIQAGIDPKTGLPIRYQDAKLNSISKADMKLELRIVDEQDAVNRYTWYNLPQGLNSHLIEWVLYYRGQGMFFYLNDRFYFLPYTLSAPPNSTGLDVYGRFTGVSPLTFNGNIDSSKDKPFVQGKIFIPQYEAPYLEEFADKSPEELANFLEDSCVLLHDYTPQISQTNISRQRVNEPILDLMSEIMPFMRTTLLNSTGVMGLRVENEDMEADVYRLSNAINRAALNGEKYVGITGALDFQELTGAPTAKAEEFMLALQSIDNYRLSLFGLDNGGLFMKKSHILEAEQEMNQGSTGLVAEDGLRNRQEFCTICNTIWGLSMWCEPSECTIGMDRDGDMVAGNDGEHSTEQKAQEASANE
jgi:hypothetical protein